MKKLDYITKHVKNNISLDLKSVGCETFHKNNFTFYVSEPIIFVVVNQNEGCDLQLERYPNITSEPAQQKPILIFLGIFFPQRVSELRKYVNKNIRI